MAESELEKEVKEIRKDLDTINKKIDLVIDELKKKDSDSGIGGTFKDSYQLFLAGIFGAISGVLINSNLATPNTWGSLEIIAILFALAIFLSP
jgi:hypothetical protein